MPALKAKGKYLYYLPVSISLCHQIQMFSEFKGRLLDEIVVMSTILQYRWMTEIT